MAGFKYPQALAWIDIETTGLPKAGNGLLDFRDVHILEVALLITDFDLNPISGYEEVLKLTPEGADALRANPKVVEMHRANGLLKESASAPAEHTLAYVEAEMIKLFQETTSFEPGEFMIAGSGVAAFDLPMISAKMPHLQPWLAYYPFDIGVLRRTLKVFMRGDVVNPTPASYQDGVKIHRAMSDVRAHIEEAQKYQAWGVDIRALEETR